jgi:hypothetical protein
MPSTCTALDPSVPAALRSAARERVRAGGEDVADEDKPLSNLANGFDKADAQERI